MKKVVFAFPDIALTVLDDDVDPICGEDARAFVSRGRVDVPFRPSLPLYDHAGVMPDQTVHVPPAADPQVMKVYPRFLNLEDQVRRSVGSREDDHDRHGRVNRRVMHDAAGVLPRCQLYDTGLPHR